MAFFDDLMGKVQDITKTGVEKSKQLGEIAKLKASSIAEEENIKKAYLSLGKLYYAERGMAPEAAYAALCEKITASKVNIEENKSRIEQLKAESGVNDLADDVKDAGSAFAERAKTAADGLKAKIDEAMKTTGEAADTVVEEAQDTAEAAADVVSDTVEEVKDAVDTAVEEVKDDLPKE